MRTPFSVGLLVYCLVLFPAVIRAASVTVDVGYNGTLAFRDEASNSISSSGVPAVTRIHEGDTVQFTWQGFNHSIVPYDATVQNTGFSESVTANTITASSTWDPLTRSSAYHCGIHAIMTGQIYVYEVANKLSVSAPPTVAAGTPFTVTVTAAGPTNTSDDLYAGTVHFTISDTDPGVVKPGDYAFTSGDNGSHAFGGVILKTVGTQTITVTDTASGITGTVTLTVQACQTHYSFSNAMKIAIPGAVAATAGPAKPYPSVINVSGVTGTVARVAVTLRGLAHKRLEDVDVLLVSPDGRSMIILSDVGSNPNRIIIPTTYFYYVTLTDRPTLPSWVNLGYKVMVSAKPINIGSGDVFPPPAPSPPYASPAPVGTATFGSVFGGSSPNGAWKLYVVDDTAAATGGIAQGWTLTIDTVCP